MSQSVKEGWLKKWSPGKNKWTDVYVKLLNTRWFQWFETSSSISPKRSIDVATVSAFLAFGEVINRVPSRPASISPTDISRALGIPHEPHMGTKMSFFLANSDTDANAWIAAIHSVLQVQMPASGPPASSAPPAYPTTNPLPYPTSSLGFNNQGTSQVPYPTQMPAVPAMPTLPSYQSPYPTHTPVQYPTQAPQSTISYPAQPATTQYSQAAFAQQPIVYQSGSGMRPVEGQVLVNPGGQAYKVVVVDGKRRKKKLRNTSNLGSAALGGLGGLAAGLTLSNMFGGGWGHHHHYYDGWGPGYGGFGYGSWSSFSSFSSFSWSS